MKAESNISGKVFVSKACCYMEIEAPTLHQHGGPIFHQDKTKMYFHVVPFSVCLMVISSHALILDNSCEVDGQGQGKIYRLK